MNKSTPISQLPTQSGQGGQGNSQNAFINDQQRQMITQQQQAVGNITMPQNTQLPVDVLNEDDGVIQDMLNNLNSSQQDMGQQSGQSGQYMPQQYQQDELLRLAAMNNLNINQMYTTPQVNIAKQPLSAQFTQLFTSELKLSGIVFLAVILVQLIPFARYISKYIAIDRIPYHDIILKASIASMLVVIAKRLI